MGTNDQVERNNKRVFAWLVEHMRCIDPKDTCDKLDINPSVPIKQIPWRMDPDRKIKVYKEIIRLLVVDFIKPVTYPKWVSNIVAVPKKNGKIRVCIDFTNLSKSCLMYLYLLLQISDLVDVTTGF